MDLLSRSTKEDFGGASCTEPPDHQLAQPKFRRHIFFPTRRVRQDGRSPGEYPYNKCQEHRVVANGRKC